LATGATTATGDGASAGLVGIMLQADKTEIRNAEKVQRKANMSSEEESRPERAAGPGHCSPNLAHFLPALPSHLRLLYNENNSYLIKAIQGKGKQMAATDSSLLQVQTLYSHHGWLLGWLRRKLGHVSGNAEAADLAQDTFLRILVSHQREPAPELKLREPRAYLVTVATRVLFNHYRRLSLEQAYLQALEHMPQALAPSPEDRLVVLETLNEIDAMLDALPAKARSAFLLSQLEGLTYQEIANQLDVSVRTVKRYMALAFEECIMLGT
jgi:RNA polymerase sigma-70 factor (ECF subfamily)